MNGVGQRVMPIAVLDMPFFTISLRSQHDVIYILWTFIAFVEEGEGIGPSSFLLYKKYSPTTVIDAPVPPHPQPSRNQQRSTRH